MDEMKNLTSSIIKKRNPIIAFLFSFLIPGLGQLYNGQYKKAILFMLLVWIICSLTFYVPGVISTFVGLIIYLITDFILRTYIGIDAIIIATHSKKYKIKTYNKWYFYVLFVIIIYFFNLPLKSFLNTYFKYYSVSSISMENTLLKGDYLVCNMRYYNREIHRSDIIIFEHNESKQPVVYRVVGLPNDKIEIINKIVYINDTIYNQDSIKFIDSRIIPRDRGKFFWDNEFKGSKDNFGPITVPDNQYFVLVDNFDVSPDSRYLGCIRKDKIIGKPLYVCFSFGEDPINDYKDYIMLDSNPKTKIRKSRIGTKIK